MIFNATDDLCWRDCETEGAFFVNGDFVTSTWLWNDWFNTAGLPNDAHRAECLGCNDIGGYLNPWFGSNCCYGLS